MDFRLSTNILSALNVRDNKVITGLNNKSEKFNSFKPAIGIIINYQVNKKLHVEILPSYSFQYNITKTTFYAKKMKELIMPIGISYRF